MASVIADLVSWSGFASLTFTNLSVLIPALLRIVFFCVLLSSVFRVMGKFAEIFINWRKW